MYLDPGFAMVIQVIVGALVAIPTFILLFWKKIKSYFSRVALKKNLRS